MLDFEVWDWGEDGEEVGFDAGEFVGPGGVVGEEEDWHFVLIIFEGVEMGVDVGS